MEDTVYLCSNQVYDENILWTPQYSIPKWPVLYLYILKNEILNLSNSTIIVHHWDALKKFVWLMLWAFTIPETWGSHSH